MQLLPPTLHGPVSECSEVVRVGNVRLGATVDLVLAVPGEDGGVSLLEGPPPVAEGAWINLRVDRSRLARRLPPYQVYARQTLEDHHADSRRLTLQWSPGSSVPPVALGSFLGHCSSGVRIRGAVPGVRVSAAVPGQVTRSAMAVVGWADIRFETGVVSGQEVTLSQEVCGETSTQVKFTVVSVPEREAEPRPTLPMLSVAQPGAPARRIPSARFLPAAIR